MSRADLDELLDEVLRYAQKLQSKHGEFYPFAFTRDAEGKVGMNMATTENDRPLSTELIELLEQGLLERARSGEIRAAGLCYDARVTAPTGGATDAICVNLEDETESVTVYLPYRKSFLGQRKYGDLFSNSREPRLFGPVTSA